jgi:hypothetical protein
MGVDRRPVIRASEVGRYVFCATSWWMGRVAGRASGNVRALRQGEAAHHRHGRAIGLSGLLRWLAWALLFVAAVLALMGTISAAGELIG